MPSETWEKFLSNFGRDATDNLVSVRNNKIETARNEVVAQIKRITDTGLVETILTNQLRMFDTARTRALAKTTNTDKAQGLQPVKDNMRALAQRARVEADRRLAQLATDLEEAKRRVRGKAGAAEKYQVPVLRTSLVLPLATVLEEEKEALAESKDADKVSALNAIDLAPLIKALKAAQPGETKNRALQAMLRMGKQAVDRMYPCGERTEYRQQLATFEQRIENTLKQVDMDYVLAELGRIHVAFNKVIPAMSKLGFQHKEIRVRIDIATKRINTVVKQGQARATVKSTARFVTGPLEAVVNARDTALRLPRHDDQADDLEAIDLVPLEKAIAQAQDLDLGVPQLYAAVATILDKREDNQTTQDIRSTYQTLGPEYLVAGAMTDPTLAKAAYLVLKTKLTKLMDRALKGGGDELYEEALQARFGVSVTKVNGAHLHLEKTYQMMALVPESHVGHEKCGTVFFSHSDKGGASYADSKITMSDYGDNQNYTYTPNGRRTPVNGFNVSMLHEIGHSVDDKFTIMDTVMDTAGYGQWHKEDYASVLEVYTKAAIADMRSEGSLESTVEDAVENAMRGAFSSGAQPDKLEDTTDNQHKALLKYTAWAADIRVDAKPWFNAKITTYIIDGRIYLQSYKHEWNSYAASERTRTTTVRNYQWRAPGEWFADLYGYCWLKNIPAPNGVGAKVKPWFPTQSQT